MIDNKRIEFAQIDELLKCKYDIYSFLVVIALLLKFLSLPFILLLSDNWNVLGVMPYETTWRKI